MSYPSDPYGASQGWPGQQPAFGGQPGYGAQPDNYLVWAILCTVLCCLPFGIVSIVNSTKVSSLWVQGRQAEAYSAAAAAKKWAIIGAVTGLAAYVIGTILWFVIFAAAMSSVDHSIHSTYTTYGY